MKKKIIYAVCMMGLVVLVATSCKKKEENATYSAQIASLENGGAFGDEDRAYMDPATLVVYWNTGDEIKVYNINESNPDATIAKIYTVDEGGTTSSHLTGEDVGLNSVFYAFYPASMCKTGENVLDGTYEVFELDDEQELATPGGAWTFCNTSLPMAAKCTDHHTFDFNNIFGVARFRLTAKGANNKTYRLAGLKVVDNHFHLSGQVTLKPHKLNPDKLSQIMTAFKAGQELTDIAEYNNYVLSHTGDGLGYSASAAADANSITYSLLGREDGGLEMSADNNQWVDVLVALRPGALAYGFTLYAYVYQGLVPPTDFSDCLEIEVTKWVNANRNYVSEPNKIKTFKKDITEYFPQ